MVKIEAIIGPDALPEVESAMDRIGVHSILISEVSERNTLTGPMGVYRGARYLVKMPRLRLEMLVPSDRSEEVLNALLTAARSVRGQDGVVLSHELVEAILIKTGVPLQYADI